ncbi:type II toxin-antitoxin system HigA family antitoxin [Xylophilus sp. Leaf220]|uniref:helix-turn-helix domain-containing protein n=1 Tax=Xylophilus sp. Leaf220 TaxID=1735686 RepID=UPI0006F74BFE|nr:helix-turn-helix domain-containing protein [Xylophilus sp. Leaf220]KQM78388.1 hypothetical protein ASE76_17160 [Xylophilus sp. Leaf220]
MNVHDLSSTWLAFHEAFGLGAPIRSEAQYEEILAATDALMDELARNESSPIAGLVALLADRIQEYEARVHSWPNDAAPAHVLRFLMEEHGLKQSDLSDIASQGVISEILSGKRELNVRQIAELARRFNVSPATFFPPVENALTAVAA